MYRDLKPENLLIFDNSYVKLSDFGLAKEIPLDKSKTEAGTLAYYAPEMILRQGYGREIDLWMIGIYAYEISNYCPPFTLIELNDEARIRKIVAAAEHNRVWKNANISEELKDFINSFLKLHPKERLGCNSWEEVKNHSFFTCVDFDWKALSDMRLKSPLKPTIDTNRIKLKPYDSAQITKRAENARVFNDYEIRAWTYAED
jgi:serine/threonine protein kinase